MFSQSKTFIKNFNMIIWVALYIMKWESNCMKSVVWYALYINWNWNSKVAKIKHIWFGLLNCFPRIRLYCGSIYLDGSAKSVVVNQRWCWLWWLYIIIIWSFVKKSDQLYSYISLVGGCLTNWRNANRRS